MRIKSAGNRTQEILYMSAAILIALALIGYLIYLVRSLSLKGLTVFAPEDRTLLDMEAFQFNRYDELMKSIYPGSTTVLSTYATVRASSTSATTTSTVATSSLR